MKSHLAAILLLITAAGAVPADEWYSIDGFTVNVEDDIWIDAPFGAESDVIEFLFDDDLDPSVRGFLVEADSSMDGANAALLMIVERVARQLSRNDVVVEVESELVQSFPGERSRVVEVHTMRLTWYAVIIGIGATPGGGVSHLALIATESGEAEESLGRLIESLQIQIEEAAG